MAARTSPTAIEPEAARQADAPRRAVGARSPSVRTRIASSGSSVVSTSGRPSPADNRGVAGLVEAGHAEDDRVLDRRDLLDPEADRGVGRASRPARDPATSAAVPDRFARDDDEPGVEGGVVDDDPVEAVADLETDPLPAVLEGRPPIRRG